MISSKQISIIVEIKTVRMFLAAKAKSLFKMHESDDHGMEVYSKGRFCSGSKDETLMNFRSIGVASEYL